MRGEQLALVQNRQKKNIGSKPSRNICGTKNGFFNSLYARDQIGSIFSEFSHKIGPIWFVSVGNKQILGKTRRAVKPCLPIF